MHYFKTMIVGFALLLVAFASGYIVASMGSKNSSAATEDYPLLAKRLFVDNPNDTRINFSPLRSSLKNYFSQNHLQGSVYFEYLPTGTSININQEARYRAASLIKLPVAMELYKAKELKKIDLNQKLELKPEWLNDGYGTLYEKGAGYRLSLQEAAKIMLIESDNTALRMIIDTNDKVLSSEDRALGSLDIELTTYPDGGIDIGARSYSSFLKCLYFACYNTPEDSQNILEILTKTPFNNRIVAGVNNQEIKVAHKIGVFNTQIQSDCGIVYLKDKNYVLCVMLAGKDDPKTNETIAEISKIVHSFVSL